MYERCLSGLSSGQLSGLEATLSVLTWKLESLFLKSLPCKKPRPILAIITKFVFQSSVKKNC